MVFIIGNVDFLSLSQAFEGRHFTEGEALLGRMHRSRDDPNRRVGCKTRTQNTWYIARLAMIGLTSWPGISDNRRIFLS
jgi:hypothetical protein